MSTLEWILIGIGIFILLAIITKGKLITGMLEVIGEILCALD